MKVDPLLPYYSIIVNTNNIIGVTRTQPFPNVGLIEK